jgi:hypothetical protein
MNPKLEKQIKGYNYNVRVMNDVGLICFLLAPMLLLLAPLAIYLRQKGKTLQKDPEINEEASKLTGLQWQDLKTQADRKDSTALLPQLCLSVQKAHRMAYVASGGLVLVFIVVCVLLLSR